MQKCHYCPNETDLPTHFVAMCLPVPRIEDLIDKWGREDWFKNLEKDPSTFTPEQNNELEEMSTYDQLLNTLGKGIMCKDCIKLEGELLDKYYQISKLLNPPIKPSKLKIIWDYPKDDEDIKDLPF